MTSDERSAYMREWRRRNPDKARAATYRWREAHPEHYRELDNEHHKASHLRRALAKHGLEVK